jgi:hypothetical protein
MQVDAIGHASGQSFDALSFEAALPPPGDCQQYQYVLTRAQLATCTDLYDVFRLVSEETGVSIDDLKRMNEPLVKAWDLGTLTDASRVRICESSGRAGFKGVEYDINFGPDAHGDQ